MLPILPTDKGSSRFVRKGTKSWTSDSLTPHKAKATRAAADAKMLRTSLGSLLAAISWRYRMACRAIQTTVTNRKAAAAHPIIIGNILPSVSADFGSFRILSHSYRNWRRFMSCAVIFGGHERERPRFTRPLSFALEFALPGAIHVLSASSPLAFEVFPVSGGARLHAHHDAARLDPGLVLLCMRFGSPQPASAPMSPRRRRPHLHQPNPPLAGPR